MNGKTVVLGVCGGIAAYKACEIASRLTQGGARVHVVMTASAQRFVTPLTFQALTHQPVHTSLWPDSSEGENGVYAAMAHIALADEADAILVAPASANALARLANGLADDLLSTLILATRAPVLLCPAMNPQMWAHPATQRNTQVLAEQPGYTILAPESGRMACEHIGAGRLPQNDIILAELERVLNARVLARDLEGVSVLVTAGPTREFLDPVRFLTNRSSGKMGYAIAENAAKRGARVVLVSGPTQLQTPRNVETIHVGSTQQMFEAATRAAQNCDMIVAAAAPADYRASEIATQKIKKPSTRKGAERDLLKLELEATPDIVAHLGKGKTAGQVIIGFAAETGAGEAEAKRKLAAKNLDAIVFNDVTQSDAGFDVETNRVTWILPQSEEVWPMLPKTEVAARILDEAKKLRAAKK